VGNPDATVPVEVIVAVAVAVNDHVNVDDRGS
jgi:hypothetical protein